MRMTDTVLKPMHPEGWRFVGIFAAATLVLFFIWNPLGWLGVLLTIWCYYFFRDPIRQVPQGEGLVISPADGIVSQVTVVPPPPELGMDPAPLTRISVFMSVFNVHVNRSPVTGTLERMAYTPGKFVNASLDKASEHNERNALLLSLPDGRQIACVQIAGLVARRILPFVKEGASLRAGERFGLIRFGSRVDIYLPPGVPALVAQGQTMIAGETVLATLAGDTAPVPPGPIDPMRRRHRPSRSRFVSLPQLLPNMLTLGSICAGLTAIRFSIDGRYGEAVWLVMLAAILDALDGRMARMLRSESAIGAELDSLADFLNFGVATGLLVYLSTLQDVSSFGWIAVLIYVICCVMRLARFNVDSRLLPGPTLGGFIGVPSPAGAMLALMPVFLRRAVPELPEVPGFVPTAWLIIVGFLMISRIPTPSLKLLRFSSEQLPYLVVLMVAVLALLFTYPWWTLLAADIIYICIVLWSVLSRRNRPAKGNIEDAS